MPGLGGFELQARRPPVDDVDVERDLLLRPLQERMMGCVVAWVCVCVYVCVGLW